MLLQYIEHKIQDPSQRDIEQVLATMNDGEPLVLDGDNGTFIQTIRLNDSYSMEYRNAQGRLMRVNEPIGFAPTIQAFIFFTKDSGKSAPQLPTDYHWGKTDVKLASDKNSFFQYIWRVIILAQLERYHRVTVGRSLQTSTALYFLKCGPLERAWELLTGFLAVGVSAFGSYIILTAPITITNRSLRLIDWVLVIVFGGLMLWLFFVSQAGLRWMISHVFTPREK